MLRKKIKHFVLAAYEKTGVLLRATSSLQEDINSNYTVSGSFVCKNVAMSLFSKINSGVIISPGISTVEHVYKRDANTAALIGATENTAYERPNNIKDIHNLRNLKQKMLEMEHRRKGISPDVDKNGNEVKTKVKVKKIDDSDRVFITRPYRSLSSLAHNEILFNLKIEDIRAIYICFHSKESIKDAFNFEKILGTSYDFFTYDPHKGLILIQDLSLFKEIEDNEKFTILSVLSESIHRYISSDKFHGNEMTLSLCLGDFDLRGLSKNNNNNNNAVQKIMDCVSLQKEVIYIIATKPGLEYCSDYTNLYDVLKHLNSIQRSENGFFSKKSDFPLEIIKKIIFDILDMAESKAKNFDELNDFIKDKLEILQNVNQTKKIKNDQTIDEFLEFTRSKNL
ncbi:MAG: hypothetical protein H0W64_10045 [Gammaproteobacteria bacterium]|nr:hypothetical protein [Gammaproteobacteria bacterium]